MTCLLILGFGIFAYGLGFASGWSAGRHSRDEEINEAVKDLAHSSDALQQSVDQQTKPTEDDR